MKEKKPKPDRNVEALVRHVLAIDYAEAKLEERLSKVKTPKTGMKEREYLQIISQLQAAYEEYRRHVNYHLAKAFENIQKLRGTGLGSAVERALGTRMLENKSLYRKYVLERNFNSLSRSGGFTRGDELGEE